MVVQIFYIILVVYGIPVPLPADNIPLPVSMGKPMDTHTRDSRVWVSTGTGTGTFKFTHGLPVSNTTLDSLVLFHNNYMVFNHTFCELEFS